jgi:hypothetical protein
VLVDEGVVPSTGENEVAERGLAAVGPVLDVVGVEEEDVGAAGEGALVLLAEVEGATDSGGNRAGAAADVENVAAVVLDDLDEGGVAAEAARRLRGDAGSSGVGDEGAVHLLLELGVGDVGMHLAGDAVLPELRAVREEGLAEEHEAVGARGIALLFVP